MARMTLWVWAEIGVVLVFLVELKSLMLGGPVLVVAGPDGDGQEE
jgi:hypothetical protein